MREPAVLLDGGFCGYVAFRDIAPVGPHSQCGRSMRVNGGVANAALLKGFSPGGMNPAPT